jgi:hypothetical protein
MIYLESKDENLIEISIDEFIRESKSFVNGKINKSEAIKILKLYFDDLARYLEPNKISTLLLETEPSNNSNYKEDYVVVDLVQQFVIFYAEKLNQVLCNKALNPKYVRATGNPAISDINIYGVKKQGNNVIIKSFIFATTPSDEEIYVSTTCGSGGTSALFEDLKKMIKHKDFNVKENNKIRYIHLDSIEKENTINFYSKLGFYKTNKDTKTILKNMIKKIYKKNMTFDAYIRQSTLNIGGSMYWADDNYTKKKLKIKYTYTPLLWYTNIEKFKKDGLSETTVLQHFYKQYHELKNE